MELLTEVNVLLKDCQGIIALKKYLIKILIAHFTKLDFQILILIFLHTKTFSYMCLNKTKDKCQFLTYLHLGNNIFFLTWGYLWRLLPGQGV